MERVQSELGKLVQHGCGDALHVAELCGPARADGIKGSFAVALCVWGGVRPYQCIDPQHKEHQEEHDGPEY